MNEIDRARRYALWRLARWSQSSSDLRKALLRKEYSDEVASQVIDCLTQAGFLDDDAYAKRLVASQRAAGKGPAAIRYKLRQKGLAVEQEGLEEDQEASIAKLLATKYHKRDLMDYKERQKVVAALARRGFAFDAIFNTLNKN